MKKTSQKFVFKEKFYNFYRSRVGYSKKKKTYLENIEEDGKLIIINYYEKIALFKSLLDQSDYI